MPLPRPGCLHPVPAREPLNEVHTPRRVPALPRLQGQCGVGAVDVQGRACTQTVAVLSGGVPWGTAVTK